ncbi:hypothetical protein E4I85_01690 [Campylobacter jejuni]|nr:hypothetical protein [Campylobacter jejuni]EAH9654983.1 hypothetical protein [Campylobacter jejuni]EAI3436453.1 hypothetical protein [Campylobacter jejuni]EAK0085653.1 hypothetical protein [Campylobacter jejuni]EAK0857182.1 hypothetical protein [Campylobacter jejuni]
MKENIEKLFQAIAQKNPIHSKYLKKIEFPQEDEEEFDKLISYYIQDGISIKEQCDCYLLILNDTLKETKFFIENGAYRYSSFDEVKDLIEKSGLKFKAYECFMANDYSLEKALKFKNAITMAVVLNA